MEAETDVDVDEVVHACPLPGTYVTACCGRSPLELPLDHRLTLDDALVTCAAPPPLLDAA